MLNAGKLAGVWYKGNHAFLSDYTGRKQATELNGVDGFVLPLEALEGEDAVGRSKRVGCVLVYIEDVVSGCLYAGGGGGGGAGGGGRCILLADRIRLQIWLGIRDIVIQEQKRKANADEEEEEQAAIAAATRGGGGMVKKKARQTETC